MSTRIGEVGGSQSINAEYDFSSEGTQQRKTQSVATNQNSVQRASGDEAAAAAVAAVAQKAIPQLAAGLLSLLGGAPLGGPGGAVGSAQELAQILGFILNVASLLRNQGASGGQDGAGQVLSLVGEEAMRQACGDDESAVTELAGGVDVAGSFDERAGWRTEGSGKVSGALGTAEGHYEASAEARVAGQGSAHVGLDGASAQGSLYAGVEAKAEADGHLESAPITKIGNYEVTAHANGHAEAEVGACATAKGQAVVSYAPPEAAVDCDVGAFAGARAGVDGEVGVGPVAATGSVEAWAGIGAEAKLDAGFHDGKLTLNYGAGLAVGVGCAYGGAIEIDVMGALKGIGGLAGMFAGEGVEQLFDLMVDAAISGAKSGALASATGNPEPGATPGAQAPAPAPTTSPTDEVDEAEPSVEDDDDEDDDRAQIS